MDTIITIDRLLNDNKGTFRTNDAVRAGISRITLSQLVKKGKLERVGQGQYISPDDIPDELYILQQRSKKIIFSHETALFLHGMAERTPLFNSLTIPSNSKLSLSISDSCKIYYVKPILHSLGQSIVMSNMGNQIIAYDIERTICDIIRSRSRIDSQTFTSALKNYTVRKEQNWNKLREYSETFRITKLLQQYLDVLI